MKMPSFLRIIAAITAVAVTPFAVTALLKNPPDMSSFMNAAITFTAPSGFVTETIDQGGGNLILYKPSPREQGTIAPTETT